MSRIMSELGEWGWLIGGIVLMLLETLAPGVFLFWLGLAALVVGLVSLLVAWSWQAQILAFAVVAVALVPLWRRFSFPRAPAPDNPFLNRRSEALVGRVLTLEKPIIDGAGTVRIDDTVWRVTGPDAPAGSRVRVVRAEGAGLVVSAVN